MWNTFFLHGGPTLFLISDYGNVEITFHSTRYRNWTSHIWWVYSILVLRAWWFISILPLYACKARFPRKKGLIQNRFKYTVHTVYNRIGMNYSIKILMKLDLYSFCYKHTFQTSEFWIFWTGTAVLRTNLWTSVKHLPLFIYQQFIMAGNLQALSVQQKQEILLEHKQRFNKQKNCFPNTLAQTTKEESSSSAPFHMKQRSSSSWNSGYLYQYLVI